MTMLMMGAAIFAAIYARRAAIANERTADLAKDAARETTEALAVSTRNADAVVRLAQVNERFSNISLRPYLVFLSAHIENGADDVSIVLDLRNNSMQIAVLRKLRYNLSWTGLDNQIELITADDVELEYIIPIGHTAELPINIKFLPKAGSKQGQLVAILEAVYTGLHDDESYSAPGSFMSEKLRSFAKLKAGISLTPMSGLLVPAPLRCEDPSCGECGPVNNDTDNSAPQAPARRRSRSPDTPGDAHD